MRGRQTGELAPKTGNNQKPSWNRKSHKPLGLARERDDLRKYTNNEEEILRWASRTQAHPIERSPYQPDGEPAQLGFVFGDVPEAAEHLQPLEWSRFFALFHLLGLVLAYEDGQFELLKLETPDTSIAGQERRLDS